MNTAYISAININESRTFDIIKGLLVIGLILTVCEFCFGVFSEQRSLTDLYLLQLGIVFSLSYSGTVIKLGWTHLFSLLQFTTFVFMVSTPLLSPLADGDTIRIAYAPIRNNFKEEIVQRVMLIFSIYISTSFLAYFSFFKKTVLIKNTFNDEIQREMYYKAGRFCMITMLPFAFLYTTFLMTISREDLYSFWD